MFFELTDALLEFQLLCRIILCPEGRKLACDCEMMIALEESNDAAQIRRQRFQVRTNATENICFRVRSLVHVPGMTPVPKKLFGHYFKARTL